MAVETMTLRVSLPFWWREYLGFLIFVQSLGFEVDVERAAKFIADYCQFSEVRSD